MEYIVCGVCQIMNPKLLVHIANTAKVQAMLDVGYSFAITCLDVA